jgi:hypothetical protein
MWGATRWQAAGRTRLFRRVFFSRRTPRSGRRHEFRGAARRRYTCMNGMGSGRQAAAPKGNVFWHRAAQTGTAVVPSPGRVDALLFDLSLLPSCTVVLYLYLYHPYTHS